MKRKMFALLILPFVLSFKGKLEAQEVGILNLTIEKAVEIALENNISIKKSYIDVERFKAADMFSWNSISPSFNANGAYRSNLEENGDSFTITGTASMNLSTNLYTTMRAARLNYENGLMSYEQTKRMVEHTVRKTFYGLLYEKENIELQKRGLETSRIQYFTNQEKFKNGKISELDVMTSRVTYEQKKPLVESAEITFLNDLSSFKQVLGVSQDVKLEISGSLDDILTLKPISLENLPKSDEPSPDIKSAEKALEIAKNSLLSSRFSAYGPTIQASFSVSDTNSHVVDPTTKEATSEREWGDLSKTLSVGVNIPLDGILPWSNSVASIRNSKKAVESAELTLENTKTTVQIQTENYLRKINQSVLQVSSLKQNLELAEQAYSLSKTAYNYGKTDLLSMQSSSDALLSAGVSVKQQAYSLISTVLDLESLLGIPFGTLAK